MQAQNFPYFSSSQGLNYGICIAKTTMKIAKLYWYGAKKYTSKAKIILLKQYTSVWKFRSNTPDNDCPVIGYLMGT